MGRVRRGGRKKKQLCPNFCYAGQGAGELAPKEQSDTELILRKRVGLGRASLMGLWAGA